MMTRLNFTNEEPMPSLNHGYVQGKLYSALDKLGKYLVVPNLSLQLDDKPYIPDLCLFCMNPKRLTHYMTK